MKRKEPEIKTVETFRSTLGYWINTIREDNPSCLNGIVSVERWRVTVEKIEESPDVICERLEKLWCESDNHHHYRPIQAKALEYGYTFKGEFGENRKKRS